MNSQFPNAAAIATRLNAHFNNLATFPVVLPDEGTLYSIEANFGTLCKSWKGKMQPQRFGRTTATNILYRSQIVDKLHAMADTTLLTPNTGIMVSGPQGIGKSHTLVNLVLKLQSTRNYLVTFVPNCRKCYSSDFLLKVICDSFGIDVYGTEGLNRLTPTNGPTPPIQVHELEEVIEAILDHLQSIGKAWVFVFDQINSLFARQPGVTKISQLGYPACYIEDVMREGVISIISASANNEISMIESHVGFEAFEHSSIMSDEELMAVFGNEIEVPGVHESTGSVTVPRLMGNTQSAEPFPNPSAIEKCLRIHFDTLAAHPVEIPDDGTLYSIEQRFGTLCNYWKNDVQMESGRFGRTDDANILYRSQIVEELFTDVEEALNTPKRGIMVKGPQGIGKSHTLVNLVLRLQSTGNYLVTFVPNSAEFDSSDYLLKVICNSFGIKGYGTEGLNRLTPTNGPTPPIQVHELEEVIEAILDHLQSIGKEWVFVFDQINALFARFPGTQSFDNLGYPFFLVRQVMRLGILSVISASANNEIAYIENHVGFDAYNHMVEMSDDELETVFQDELASTTDSLETIKESAGSIPQYVKKFLLEPELFEYNLNAEMKHSIEKMQCTTNRWPEQLKSIVHCVLGLQSSSIYHHDRKYQLPEPARGYPCRFMPLFPMVVQAYRSILWDDIMAFVCKEESVLLETCQRGIGGSAIGQLYEYMVIQRIRSSGLKIPWGNSSVHIKPSADQKHLTMFPGKVLPPLPSRDGVWVPLNSNFTAIDFFIKSGKNVIGVQVHVSTHKDVTENFFKLCEDAGWFDAVPGSEIGLVYLSPTKTTTDMVKSLVVPVIHPERDPNIPARRKRVDPRIRRVALASSSIKGLETIAWG
jgi:Cdc6-like AAA superfamily ATPase